MSPDEQIKHSMHLRRKLLAGAAKAGIGFKPPLHEIDAYVAWAELEPEWPARFESRTGVRWPRTRGEWLAMLEAEGIPPTQIDGVNMTVRDAVWILIGRRRTPQPAGSFMRFADVKTRWPHLTKHQRDAIRKRLDYFRKQHAHDFDPPFRTLVDEDGCVVHEYDTQLVDGMVKEVSG